MLGVMGREVRCLVRHGGEEAEAKALLETDEIIVRSPFRISVARSDIASTAVHGDRLEVATPGGPLVLELGEREATRWAHEIANPKTVADKLGVKPGQRVRIIDGPFNEFIGTVGEIDMEKAKVRVMVSFFGRETPVELDFLQVEKA